MTTESLADWLRAQLDDDDAVAKAVGGPWKLRDHEAEYWMIADAGGDAVVYDEGRPTDAEAAHIARWDPARVLAEVAAKRRILELHTGDHQCQELHTGTYGADWPAEVSWGEAGKQWRHASSEYIEGDCETLRLLALPYAGRDGWREEWRPE